MMLFQDFSGQESGTALDVGLFAFSAGGEPGLLLAATQK